jgi:MOSC domain-containing protein YiiM
MVECIFISREPGRPVERVGEVRVVAGSGIEGDRYFGAADEPGQNITLVEAEEIERFNREHGTAFDLSCTRRNLVTRGVRLAALVGEEFTVGDVRLRGVELCEPCLGLGRALASTSLPPAGVVRAFAHRAGIRADVLASGTIAVGAAIARAT